MMSHRDQQQQLRLLNQKTEFNALQELCSALNALPPIVDDDYPVARAVYEQKLSDFIRALISNGRI